MFSDFIDSVVMLVVLFALVLAVVLGLSYANAHWNCNSWASSTGAKTKVIAAECYVDNNGRWELFGTYIRNHRAEIKVIE